MGNFLKSSGQSQSINLIGHNVVNFDRIFHFSISMSRTECKTCKKHPTTSKPGGQLTIICKHSSIECQSCAEDDSYCKHQNKWGKGSCGLGPCLYDTLWTPTNDRLDRKIGFLQWQSCKHWNCFNNQSVQRSYFHSSTQWLLSYLLILQIQIGRECSWDVSQKGWVSNCLLWKCCSIWLENIWSLHHSIFDNNWHRGSLSWIWRRIRLCWGNWMGVQSTIIQIDSNNISLNYCQDTKCIRKGNFQIPKSFASWCKTFF